jgi:hypothetical protein
MAIRLLRVIKEFQLAGWVETKANSYKKSQKTLPNRFKPAFFILELGKSNKGD